MGYITAAFDALPSVLGSPAFRSLARVCRILKDTDTDTGFSGFEWSLFYFLFLVLRAARRRFARHAILRKTSADTAIAKYSFGFPCLSVPGPSLGPCRSRRIALVSSGRRVGPIMQVPTAASVALPGVRFSVPSVRISPGVPREGRIHFLFLFLRAARRRFARPAILRKTSADTAIAKHSFGFLCLSVPGPLPRPL